MSVAAFPTPIDKHESTVNRVCQCRTTCASSADTPSTQRLPAPHPSHHQPYTPSEALLPLLLRLLALPLPPLKALLKQPTLKIRGLRLHSPVRAVDGITLCDQAPLRLLRCAAQLLGQDLVGALQGRNQAQSRGVRGEQGGGDTLADLAGELVRRSAARACAPSQLLPGTYAQASGRG